MKFEREDWTSFRTIEGLQQKAGVPKDKLARLVLKELTDNGLDTGAEVEVGPLPKGGFYVEDKGPGIDGTPEEIAHLFSIARPMISTKLLRLPTRGALGNGLRVVAGAVLVSEGALVVTTRNKRIQLRPERDGSTTVINVTETDFPTGTMVATSFGSALLCDDDPLSWARSACNMAEGTIYSGKTSPHWYDVPQFLELLSASGDVPVRQLIAELDGCTGSKAGEIVAEAGLIRATCRDITQPSQAKRLLEAARANSKQVNPARLGAIGPDGVAGETAYAVTYGVAKFGADEPQAEIPFVVECWASSDDGTSLFACVNRTPIAGDVYASRDKRDIDFFGCGLHHTAAQAPVNAHFQISINIVTPYMPITSDGKEPDLTPFLREIKTAVGKAAKKVHNPKSRGGTQKDTVLANLADVIADVSGDGLYRFNARQLFYGLRPIIKQELDQELKLGNFTAIIDDYEAENGEIRGMYREPRGSIYHPHRGETITLGTLMVEEYERPIWTFNKLLYIEKEGANEALKEVGWPERHDCAVLSSKGFSTRAARDLIDKLAEHDEPVEVFCAHDADGPGTVIHQTLQEATKARGARKIKITNIGLEPWEAIEMGLEVETLEESKRRKPVADYVLERDAMQERPEAPDGETWEEWLQTHRVELNAMTTPRLIEWLDAKMAEHGVGKLVPPQDVIEAEFAANVEANVRTTLTEKILREAGLERQVKAAIKKLKKPTPAVLAKGIRQSFKEQLDREWRAHIESEARRRTSKV